MSLFNLRENQHLIPTIVVIADPQADTRGYSILNREFILKEPKPSRREAIMTDGHKLVDEFYVISKAEYMRVIPQARDRDFSSDVVLIPVAVARLSFRPSYLK